MQMPLLVKKHRKVDSLFHSTLCFRVCGFVLEVAYNEICQIYWNEWQLCI